MPTNQSHLYAEAKSQALVRLVICAFMGVYYAMFGLANHPVYLAFAGYTISLFAWTRYRKGNPRITAAISLVVDNAFAICGLNVTGESGTFLLFFLIHISFAYGLRFGREYLISSLLLSCLGVSWLYLTAAPWQGRIHFLLSFLFGMPFIAFYVYALTERLRISEALAKKSDERTAQLLTFLTHDIRAPLQSLLESVRRLKCDNSSPKNRFSLSAMERIVIFMARMVSGVLDGQRLTERSKEVPKDAREMSSSVSVNQWVFSFCEAFRDSVQSKNASFHFSLDAKIEDLDVFDRPHLERVLINVISNALRHCENGYVGVSTTLLCSAAPKVRIAVENAPSQQSPMPVRSSLDIDQLDSKLHGAGLGLDAAQDAANRAGASFKFADIDGVRFCSELEIARKTEPRSRSFSTVSPVVVISLDASDWLTYSESLGSTANIYWMSATDLEANGLPEHTNSIDPIYVYLEAKGLSGRELTISRSFSGTRYLLVSDAPNMALERVLVDEWWVRLRREAPIPTWVLALEIVDSIGHSSDNETLGLGEAYAAMRNLRILALDDNPLNLALLNAGLSNYNVKLEQFSTISEAKKELLKNKYDLLILDWNIGFSTANDLVSMLTLDFKNDSPNILILTAQEIDISAIGPAVSSRIKILVKPVTTEVIFSTLCDLASIDRSVGPRSGEIVHSEIFNFSVYLELGLTNTTLRLAEALLTEFIEELRSEFFDKQDLSGKIGRHELDLDLHKLASMCYSAGAYALGDIFKQLRYRVSVSERERISQTDCDISAAHYLYALTQKHVDWFLISLRNYLRNNADSDPASIPLTSDY